jgi:hypothetical protein
MINESDVSDETFSANLVSFPAVMKIRIIKLIGTERTAHDQMLVIYYNKNKNNRLFSFEHLCSLANDIIDIPINKLISKYRKTGEWDLTDIAKNKLQYIVEEMLKR